MTADLVGLGRILADQSDSEIGAVLPFKTQEQWHCGCLLLHGCHQACMIISRDKLPSTRDTSVEPWRPRCNHESMSFVDITKSPLSATQLRHGCVTKLHTQRCRGCQHTTVSAVPYRHPVPQKVTQLPSIYSKSGMVCVFRVAVFSPDRAYQYLLDISPAISELVARIHTRQCHRSI